MKKTETKMIGVRTSAGYEIAAMINTALDEGVARRGAVKAERTRSGAIVWFINGNKVSKHEATQWVDGDISCDQGPVLAPIVRSY